MNAREHHITTSPHRQISARRPIVIVGPTAGGKSDLAVALALAMREIDGQSGQIINADSMQVYRHMEAGTAKPSRKLREQVQHHLIDIVDPGERFTVADWLMRAEKLLGELSANRIRSIIVGGTNLYLKAFLEGLFEGPPLDPDLRAELSALSLDELHERLRSVDPVAADRIHRNDRKRMIRALEVHTQTGRRISEMQMQWGKESEFRSQRSEDLQETSDIKHQTSDMMYRHHPILIGLDWPTPEINQRINARVKEMFHPVDGRESLPDEVRRLDALGLFGLPGSQARQALGYKQVLASLRGEMTMDDAMEQTKILTRRFAKTQRTWLKRYRDVKWIAAGGKTIKDIAGEALTHVTASNS